MSTPLVCPICRLPLAAQSDALSCRACGSRYPLDHGIADFSAGRYYDSFQPGQDLSHEELEGLENETTGALSRVEDFYRPRLDRLRRKRGADSLRVLDCGCGSGLSVDLLADAGFEAWGNDLSALRKWQWRGRRRRDRLVVADGGRLPFPDGFFDAVICSGLLEHVGVVEEGGGRYRVTPLPGKAEARLRLLAELLRVLAGAGRLWLDFPNGAFPIDFWHGATPGAARFHRRNEGFLPTVAEVRGYLARLGGLATVRALSPHGRLRFRQVSRHWYGRLLAPLAEGYLWALSGPGLAGLRQSAANPFLVLEISRRG